MNPNRPSLVAQICNLLYRGFLIRWAYDFERPAEFNSAIRQVENLRYAKAS